MAYHRRRRRRPYRYSSRSGAAPQTRYQYLHQLFGGAVLKIREHFFQLSQDDLDDLFLHYGELHGASAEQYARRTYPLWKAGTTKLSGGTMDRLMNLVPPYLSPSQRYDLLMVLHKKHATHRRHHRPAIRINVKEPEEGLAQVRSTVQSLNHDDALAYLPDGVMRAAEWLYDDDITAARSLLAEAARKDLAITKASAERELDLLERAIRSGKVQSASYKVSLPDSDLNVVAYTPSKCFVATLCFGPEAPELRTLRTWRDEMLVQSQPGRAFVVWYYRHGSRIAGLIGRCPPALWLTRTVLRGVVHCLPSSVSRKS